MLANISSAGRGCVLFDALIAYSETDVSQSEGRGEGGLNERPETAVLFSEE